jgi:hypothetical protein
VTINATQAIQLVQKSLSLLKQMKSTASSLGKTSDAQQVEKDLANFALQWIEYQSMQSEKDKKIIYMVAASGVFSDRAYEFLRAADKSRKR